MGTANESNDHEKREVKRKISEKILTQAKVLSVVDTQSNRKKKKKSFPSHQLCTLVQKLRLLFFLKSTFHVCKPSWCSQGELPWTFSAEGSSFIDKIISGPKDDATLGKILCKELSPHGNSKQYQSWVWIKIFNILRWNIVEINYSFKQLFHLTYTGKFKTSQLSPTLNFSILKLKVFHWVIWIIDYLKYPFIAHAINGSICPSFASSCAAEKPLSGTKENPRRTAQNRVTLLKQACIKSVSSLRHLVACEASCSSGKTKPPSCKFKRGPEEPDNSLRG